MLFRSGEQQGIARHHDPHQQTGFRKNQAEQHGVTHPAGEQRGQQVNQPIRVRQRPEKIKKGVNHSLAAEADDDPIDNILMQFQPSLPDQFVHQAALEQVAPDARFLHLEVFANLVALFRQLAQVR